MEPYIFHEGSLPPAIALDYEESLFNLPAFASGARGPDGAASISYYLLDQRRKRAIAGIHFQVAGQVAYSPFRAPFGSVECADVIQPELLYRFLAFTEDRLKERGVVEIRIKNPPRAYAPALWSLVEVFLLNQHYEVTGAEAGTVIDVTEKPFGEVVRHSEKLRMSQGHHAGFLFQELVIDRLTDVFDFLSACHREKGYELSITADELQSAVAGFPGRYLLFVVSEKDKIRAASISIRVRKGILYNFITNHGREYNRLSPTVTLLEGMYGYCRRNGIQLLDLGTSAWQGTPKFTLLNFKRHLGGRPTSKLSFIKKLGL